MAIQVSEVEVANAALGHITEDEITSFDQERRKAASAAKLHFASTRRVLLARYRWAFATRTGVLAPDGDSPDFQFDYQFTKPTDWLALIGVFDSSHQLYQYNYTDDSIPHKVKGQQIHTDANPLYVHYIYDVTDPSEWDDQFRMAFEYLLAAKMAPKLTGSQSLAEQNYAAYREAVRHAKRINAIQGSTEITTQSKWVDSRFGGVDSAYYRGPRGGTGA